MQTRHFSSSLLFLSVILLFSALLISPQHPPSQPPSLPPSQAQPPSETPSQSPSLPPSQPQSTTVACKSTPYPKLCRTILSAFKSSPSDPYGYGKFTTKQCLKQAKRLSKVINGYAQRVRSKPGSATAEEIGALEDCGELAELTVSYLQTVTDELQTVDVMTSAVVEHVNSLLSGVVTNQQTCLDGLTDAKSGFAAAIGSPMGNLTGLYSVSLGLVSNALNRNLKRFKASKGKILGGQNSTYREPLETLIKVT